MKIRTLYKTFLISCSILAIAVGVNAQFNSGSTGADGALDLSTMTCPGNICEIQLPESGVLNYTSINVPSGKGLKFKRNSRNTSVIVLSQGNVSIAGSISLNAEGRTPGNGGFYGGDGNQLGMGPGGGTPTNIEGRWVGPLNLSPAVGGSGGFGAICVNNNYCQGGGGGGAITVASSATIEIFGSISYRNISVDGSIGDTWNGRGTKGSGGSIRLVANTINIPGSGFGSSVLSACGWQGSPSPCGVIRLEALEGQLNLGAITSPAAVLVPFQAGSPPHVITTNLPQLRITSVGGRAVPSYAGTRFDTIDLLLSNQIPDPLNVGIGANNIPTGTEVSVGIISGSANGSSVPCDLIGSFASSSCVATISNLNRSGVTYLLATATFTPPALLAQHNPKGKNYVANVRVEAIIGQLSKYVFLDYQGRAIEKVKLSKQFLDYFGQ